MRKEFLAGVSAAALILSAGAGMAQEKGGGAGGGPAGGGGAMQQQSPGAQPGGGAAERGERGQPSRSQEPRPADSRDNRAQGAGDPQKNQAQERNTQDRTQAQDRNQPGKNQAQERGDNDRNRNRAEDRNNSKHQSETRDRNERRDSTTGQGAAGHAGGASLTTEQRTKISTTIRHSNVRPVTNVNFNVSVGTVIPRGVTLHTLPAEVITVYPDWRPYRFVLVGDEIVIIDPATYRIIAVIDA